MADRKEYFATYYKEHPEKWSSKRVAEYYRANRDRKKIANDKARDKKIAESQNIQKRKRI